MKITRHAANVHTIDCEGKEAEFLLISDLRVIDATFTTTSTR